MCKTLTCPWFQCFNCRKLGLLGNSAKPACGYCGSENGNVINAEALEQILQVRTADTRLEVGNRLCVLHGFLECFHRADIRLGRATPDGNAAGDPHEVCACAGLDPAFLCELIEHCRNEEDDVESLSVFDPLHDVYWHLDG